ncbi:uncharacterized protein O3C94_023096 [Discoglossus pictus]
MECTLIPRRFYEFYRILVGPVFPSCQLPIRKPQQTGVRRVGYRDRSTTEWEPTHPFQPGDLVCVRQLNRAKKGGFPFGSPTTDVAVTRTAVLTDSQDIWIHASRLKLCPKRGEAGDKVPVKAIEDSDNENVKPTSASTECMEELSPVDELYAPDLFALMDIS